MKSFSPFGTFPTIALSTALFAIGAGAQPSAPSKTADQATSAGKSVAKSDSAKDGGDWKPLFDGKSLKGWAVTDFAGGGKIEVEKGQLVINSGLMLSGVTFTNAIPKTNYEISLEAMKVDGSDFFCGLTFPVGDSHCSLILGGWGGGVVGISSIDGMDASENETTKFLNFEKARWYHIRVRVTSVKIEAWLDDEKLVDQMIEDRRISMRSGEIELNVPFGVATYQTTAALKNFRFRELKSK